MSLDRRVAHVFGDDEPTHFGSGWISGTISVFLGLMAVGAVICFYIPELLTSPEVRAVLPIPLIRTLIQLVIAFGFLLGLLSALLRRRKVLGFSGIALAMLAALGGGGACPGAGGHRHNTGLSGTRLVSTQLAVACDRICAAGEGLATPTRAIGLSGRVDHRHDLFFCQSPVGPDIDAAHADARASFL